MKWILRNLTIVCGLIFLLIGISINIYFESSSHECDVSPFDFYIGIDSLEIDSLNDIEFNEIEIVLNTIQSHKNINGESLDYYQMDIHLDFSFTHFNESHIFDIYIPYQAHYEFFDSIGPYAMLAVPPLIADWGENGFSLWDTKYRASVEVFDVNRPNIEYLIDTNHDELTIYKGNRYRTVIRVAYVPFQNDYWNNYNKLKKEEIIIKIPLMEIVYSREYEKETYKIEFFQTNYDEIEYVYVNWDRWPIYLWNNCTIKFKIIYEVDTKIIEMNRSPVGGEILHIKEETMEGELIDKKYETSTWEIDIDKFHQLISFSHLDQDKDDLKQYFLTVAYTLISSGIISFIITPILRRHDKKEKKKTR